VRQNRILPFLGPAAVLYLVADLASFRGGLSTLDVVLGGAALLCSLVPLRLRHHAEAAGARRVGVLGVAAGVGALTAIAPSVLSLPLRIVADLGVLVAAALVLDLAISVPDTPKGLGRPRIIRAALVFAGAATLALAAFARFPPMHWAGRVWLLPAHFTHAPAWYGLAAAVGALVLRGLRRRLGSSPEALAANAWAVLGLVPAAVGALACVGLSQRAGPSFGAAWLRGLGVGALVSAVAGHVALVDPRRRLQAGPAARRVLTGGLAAATLGAAAVAVYPWVPAARGTVALLVLLVLAAGVAAYRLFEPMVRFVLAPWRGRLIDAVRRAMDELGSASTLEDAASAVLAPLRQAAGRTEAEPRLFTVDPGCEARVDAAEHPHVRAEEMPEALAAQLAERPGEIVVRPALEAVVVRRPEIRALVDALISLDALCVVPLAVRGELEGALVVPRGRRPGSPTLEEIAALQSLGDRLGALVSMVSAQGRAQRRAAALLRERDRLDEQTEALHEELQRERHDAEVLRSGRRARGRTTSPVHYSGAMRALEARIAQVAPLDAPVLLRAEGGTPVDCIARQIHEQSGRADRPFVVADCSSVRPDDSLAELVGREGSEPHPGWLRLASGGTLLLSDLPALSHEAQLALVEAIASRFVRPVEGQGAVPVDVRVVATSRVELEPLAECGVLEQELARWMAKLRIDVPPLRDRREDIPSLILLSLDRACRVLGRPTVGIEQQAVDKLLAHDWPGNLWELEHVLGRAVSHCEGSKVSAEDIPPLIARGDVVTYDEDPLLGSYAEVERRLLHRALERADGNKSEAARLLGLKRTTFLDKLRRHEPDPGRTPREKHPAE
jgi:DNA-binding NtrC family response regulator